MDSDKKNDLIRNRVLEVLERGYLLTLATTDSAGVWVSEVIFVHCDGHKIYWMSSPDVRHSRAIDKNPKVSGIITVSNSPKEKDLSVQMTGIVKKISGLNVGLSTKYLLKQGKVPVGEIALALKKGYCWYELTPDFFELTDKENFDFEKQKINL